MKAITALYLLKRKGLINKNYDMRGIKMLREMTECRTWEELVRWVMFTRYMTGSIDLTEEIRVPEVGFAIGGTVRMELKRR